MPSLTLQLPAELSERLSAHAALLRRSPEDLVVDWIRAKVPGGSLDLFAAPQAEPAARRAEPAPASTSRSAPGTWQLWADGACSGNPGPGGWGIVVRGPEGESEDSRGFRNTTNNRMELRGAIEAISRVPAGASAVLHTDSRYVVDAIEKKWVDGWRRRGWRKADGGEVKNVDLWELLVEAMAGKKVKFQWVEGHAGHAENERCDRLAVAAAKGRDLASD